MPLPFLIGAAAVALGAFGAKKAVDAYSDNKEAARLRESAQNVFEAAQEDLGYARESTATTMDELGWLKLNVWNQQIGRFVQLVEKVRNVEVSGNASTEEFEIARFTKNELAEMKKVSLRAAEVVSAGAHALGMGALAGVASYGGVMMLGTASSGAAISGLTGVAATNATLAWLGGGSLAAGGMGVAGGMAVLGGIVAAPVLAVGGMLFAAKARENLANARTNHARAREAAEEMNNAASVLRGIQKIAKEYAQVIVKINEKCENILDLLEQAILATEEREKNKLWNKIKRFFGVKTKTSYTNMQPGEQHIVHMAYQDTQVLKTLLETPILTKAGGISPDCERILGDTKKQIKLLKAA